MTDQEKIEALARWRTDVCFHDWKYTEGKTPLYGVDCTLCGAAFHPGKWGSSTISAPRWGEEREVPDFLHSFDAHIKWTIPKSGMDVLWIVNNLDSPLPQIQYVFGFTRGGDNDLVCWSHDLPPEECLSPVCEEPALACVESLLLLIKSEEHER